MQGVEFIYPRHPDFPSNLLEIAPMLFIKGQRKLLTSDGVAIVGARNVSDMGICVARELAAELANAGLNVVSGYAKGVGFRSPLRCISCGGYNDNGAALRHQGNYVKKMPSESLTGSGMCWWFRNLLLTSSGWLVMRWHETNLFAGSLRLLS